jgi:hypothetical protein
VRGHLDNGESKCISFGGIPVDERVGRDVLRVVQPTRGERYAKLRLTNRLVLQEQVRAA